MARKWAPASQQTGGHLIWQNQINKSRKEAAEMINLVYKSVVVECSTGVEDLAKAIEKQAEEMLNKGYKLVTMSAVGADKAILVFKI